MQNIIFIISWVIMLAALTTFAILYHVETPPFYAKLVLLVI